MPMGGTFRLTREALLYSSAAWYSHENVRTVQPRRVRAHPRISPGDARVRLYRVQARESNAARRQADGGGRRGRVRGLPGLPAGPARRILGAVQYDPDQR